MLQANVSEYNLIVKCYKTILSNSWYLLGNFVTAIYIRYFIYMMYFLSPPKHNIKIASALVVISFTFVVFNDSLVKPDLLPLLYEFLSI